MVEFYRLKPGLHQARIKTAWRDLMGATIAGYTQAIYLRNRKLYLTIDSPSLRQELSMSRDKIRGILNEELQEEYIEEVIIR